jgi:hypothetical protein
MELRVSSVNQPGMNILHVCDLDLVDLMMLGWIEINKNSERMGKRRKRRKRRKIFCSKPTNKITQKNNKTENQKKKKKIGLAFPMFPHM